MKRIAGVFGVSLFFALILLVGVATQEARATFMKDTDAGGVPLNLDNAKNSQVFDGAVGTDIVHIATPDNEFVDVSGANIKPIKDGTLTSLIFTPADPIFADFSFRGQLLKSGDIKVTVWDSQNNEPQDFTFAIAQPNQDFERIGIVAMPGTGETIKQVEIFNSGGFKEFKQFEFSHAAAVPEPLTFIFLGSCLLGAGLVSRKFKK
jgi:hypothetical protein